RLVGSAFSSRLVVDSWSVAFRVNGQRADPNVEVELGWEGAHFLIDESDGDGFLQKILPLKTGEIELQASVIWSSKTGVRLGLAGAELTLPIHKKLGPVELDTITIAVSTADGVTVYVAVTAMLVIGPFSATVDRVGVSAKARPIPAG